MKVVVVSPAVPYEGIPHAGGAYLHAHVEQLVARGAEVTLLCIDDLATAEQRASAPAPVIMAETAAGRRLDDVRTRLRVASLPAPAIHGLLAAGLVELAHDADIVELHWPELGILVPLLRREGVRAAIVVVEYDVGSQARDRRVGAFGASAARIAHAVLRPVRRHFERSDLDAADLVLVLKAADIDLLRGLGVRTAVHVIEPYLDEPGDGPDVREPGRILFTGALWRPDTDRSLRWFVERVWPRVAAEEPGASLTLAGAGPSDEVRALADGDPRIEVTGEVPDLGVYYRRASVFVAPLLTGGGLKFKVPQAMLYGLPVVATPIAAEGLVEEAPPGTFWRVAADPSEMADALIEAVRHPDRAAAVGAAGREWCATRFSFARSMDAVHRRYQELAAARR